MELGVIYLKPDELIPYEHNAKAHPDKQIEYIANSIKEFGFKQPIVVDKDNVVIIGHGRLLAAKKLGLENVPCVRADDLSESQVRALRLADNKTNESEWDFVELDDELADLALDFDMSDFGFEDLAKEALEELVDDESGKRDDIEYFAKSEIQQDVVNGWKTYSSIDEFVDNIIDLPTAKYQFNRLCQGYNDGYNISLLFNKHRLLTDTVQAKNIFFGFNNDEKYKKSFARYMVDVQNKTVPRNQYHRFIRLGTGGYQYVNEFQPSLARDIYKRYVNDGDKVLNPCAGWGGRLIGLAACMFNNIEYVETDPSQKTFEGLQKLKEFLRLGDNYKQYNLPFEDLQLEENYFDFVFTSPPYFDTERYSDEETQSYKRNSSYETWRDNFLFVMIDKIIATMKNGAVCILNVGNKRYQISDDIKTYLADCYNRKTTSLNYTLDTNDKLRVADEDFLLFRK